MGGGPHRLRAGTPLPMNASRPVRGPALSYSQSSPNYTWSRCAGASATGRHRVGYAAFARQQWLAAPGRFRSAHALRGGHYCGPSVSTAPRAGAVSLAPASHHLRSRCPPSPERRRARVRPPALSRQNERVKPSCNRRSRLPTAVEGWILRKRCLPLVFAPRGLVEREPVLQCNGS